MHINCRNVLNRVQRVGITFVAIIVAAAFGGVTANAASTIRVNAGGPAYTDGSGRVWQGDTGYNTGSITSVTTTVAGTSDPTLYKTDRFDATTTPELRYAFSVPNGNYQVNLYFAETWSGAMKTGGRVFNVALQGNTVFSNLDIYAAAGANRALVKSANASVTNGTLAINFTHVVQNPKINAIEIIPISTASTSTSSILLSTYYGNQGFTMQQVRDMESWQGKKNATLLLFTSFCSSQMSNLFNVQLPAIWNNKNVPLITWEPYTCTPSTTPTNIASQIGSGQYDSYIAAWADQMKKWLAGPDGVLGTSDDRRAFIRLGHEMNGNWYPWTGNPSAYISMWVRVHNAFEARGLGASYIQWAWIPNVGDVGNYTMEQYYPGNAYVDWVGVDGYNSYSTGVWKSPTDRFSGAMTRLHNLTTKPIMIPEWGALSTTSTGVSVSAKSQWISDFFSYVSSQPSIRLVSSYNRDSSTSHDWAVFGGWLGDQTFTASGVTYKTYSAHRAAVQRSNIIGPNTTNQRLLTDSQFQGR
jgi:beta-mannanase